MVESSEPPVDNPSSDPVREIEQSFYAEAPAPTRRPWLAAFGLLLFFGAVAVAGFLYLNDRNAQAQMIVLDEYDQVLSVSRLRYDQVADYLRESSTPKDLPQEPGERDAVTPINLNWSWGDVAGGLSSYLELADSAETHTPKQVLNLKYYLRNVGEETLALAGNADYPKLMLKAPFLALEVIETKIGDVKYYDQGSYKFSCMGKQYNYELAPGNAIQKRLQLIPMEDQDFVFATEYEKSRHLFSLTPGEYSIRAMFTGVQGHPPVYSNAVRITVKPDDGS